MSGKEHSMRVLTLDASTGLRVVEGQAQSARVLEVPRDLSVYCERIPETQASGVLCLLGDIQDEAPTVRVVACESLCEQLRAEHKASHGWSVALLINKRFAFLSSDEVSSFTYELKRLVMENTAQGRFDIPGGIGPEPQVPAEAQSKAEVLAKESALLVKQLGYNLFSLNSTRKGLQSDIYLCETADTYARGKPEKDGFRVFKGAKGRLGSDNGLAVKLQEDLQAEGVLRLEGSSVYFQNDHLFINHALAATALLGRSSTGFFEWKHPDGLTLGETLRESLARL